MCGILFPNRNGIILGILGAFSLLFANTLAALVLKRSPKNWMTTGLARPLLFVWPIRVVGFICLGFAVAIAISNFPQGGMKSDKNRLRLLENGEIIQGQVIRVAYQRLAPSGWEVRYEFCAKDPTGANEKTYFGSVQGPRNYYLGLSKGDNIEVLVDPTDPDVNCEIRCFLEHPSFRHTFKKAGKLDLLDRFRDKYELRDYSFEEWYRQQQTK